MLQKSAPNRSQGSSKGYLTHLLCTKTSKAKSSGEMIVF